MRDKQTPDRFNEASLPEWQDRLLNQIIYSMKRYYCLPEKLQKYNFSLVLREEFNRINQINSLQFTVKEYSSNASKIEAFITEANKILMKFDPHLQLQYAPDFIQERIRDVHIVDGRFDFGSIPLHVLHQMNEYRGHRDRNYGFICTPREGFAIPNEIGYLKIDFLLDPQDGNKKNEKGEYILGPEYRVGPNAIDALNKAMETMVGKRGIILDLRYSQEGGSPEMVQYIVSFFIRQKGISINEIHDRFTGTQNIYKTVKTPCDLFDMPVRILTDKTTFSGCEEIAYDFQQLNLQLQKTGQQIGNRFKVIGEVTHGGAHPERSFPLVDASGNLNETIVIRIPYATAINPYTNTNWEDGPKKGVQPDFEISPNQNALEIAIQSISNTLHAVKFSMTSSSVGIFKSLTKDHTRVDPYGPGAIIPYQKK